MSMTLDDLKYFKVICETLNITRASEIIGITQPTLSYALKRLESEIGSSLVVRLKNGIALTKTGEEFKKKISKIIFEWENAQKIVTSEFEFNYEYSLGIHPSVALYTLNLIIPAIAKIYPNIDFNIIHGSSRKMTSEVINWNIDFGIVVNPIKHPDLVIKPIALDYRTLFKTDKAQDKFIYDPHLTKSEALLKGIPKIKLKTKGHIHTNSLELIAKLCSEGLGVGFLPNRIAKLYPNLSEVSGAPKIKDQICLVYRKEKQTLLPSKRIIELIKSIQY